MIICSPNDYLVTSSDSRIAQKDDLVRSGEELVAFQHTRTVTESLLVIHGIHLFWENDCVR